MTITRRPLPHRSPRLPALPDAYWQAYCADCGQERQKRTAPISMLADRGAFERLAARDDVPGALGVREVKFVVADADTDRPALYFIDSATYAMHFDFTRDFLNLTLNLAAFNRQTYFTENRRYVVGSIVAYDNYLRADGAPGVYAVEFWPTDPVGVDHVALSYALLKSAMPFTRDRLAYHPTGDLQETRFVREADSFAGHGIATISTYELFEDLRYNPLNLGEAVGTLRVLSGSNRRPPGQTDIVIYDTLPNDLPLVAGVISSTPQTALSHVNLRARQNAIPNAYLRDAAQAPELRDYIGQVVRMAVTAEGLRLSPAATADRNAALEARRPPCPTHSGRRSKPAQHRTAVRIGVGGCCGLWHQSGQCCRAAQDH